MRSDLKTDYIQRDTERAGQTEKALYLLNTISAITDRGNNAEVRRKKDGSLTVYEVKKNNNTVFGSYQSFIANYEDVKHIKNGKKSKIDSSFRIFIIMDTDDCTEVQKREFINKEMFKKHWAYEYIVPIFDSPDLESVLVKANIKFEKKGMERKKEYIKIFPTEQKYISMNFLDIFKKNDVSNLTGILSEPGDKLEARVTDSNRKVVKIKKDKG